MYLTNIASGAVGQFERPQTGWRDSTQEEIDFFLLAQAKSNKIAVLDTAKSNFCETGFLYSGDYFPLPSESIKDILVKDNLLSYESDDVSAMAATSAYILPAGAGQTIKTNPGQLITVSGFTTGGNNGVKTVYQLDGDFIVIDETLTDEAVGDDIVICDANRFIYHDVDDVQVDFATKAAWDTFFSAIMGENDRIMIYDCTTKKSINDCTTVGQVDAITIDFSA